MSKVFFDRTAPFFIVKEASFDAVPVEVPDSTVEFVDNVATILVKMRAAIENSPAPEESAQNLANILTYLITPTATEEDDGGE